MLRYITKPRVSILDTALCLICGLMVPYAGIWLSAVVLILMMLVSTMIERSVSDE